MAKTEHEVALKVIADVDAAETSDDVVHLLTAFASMYGFTTVTIAQLVNPAQVKDNRLIITNWPAEYLARRLSDHIIIKDPVARYAMSTTRPFSWQAAYDQADRLGQKLLDEARDYTQNEGIMFPVYALDQVPGGVSLGTNKLEVSPEQVKLIDMVCQHAYMRITSLVGPFPYEIRVKLTNREIEVLHFAAAGKSNWEIGKIIGISEHTVHDFMRRASKKLGTSGRTHTVAMAMARQIVMP